MKNFKPFDIVSTKNGDVGFIIEVSITQEIAMYSIKWIVGKENKVAWWENKELDCHGNLFVAIAEVTCHPLGHNSKNVKKLLGF